MHYSGNQMRRGVQRDALVDKPGDLLKFMLNGELGVLSERVTCYWGMNQTSSALKLLLLPMPRHKPQRTDTVNAVPRNKQLKY